MNDRFLITKNIKEFVMSLDNVIINFPKRDFVLKERLFEDSYELLSLVYIANNDNKKKYKAEILCKLSMIDFYIERCFKNKYISQKQCLNYSNKLKNITKLVYGWMKDE